MATVCQETEIMHGSIKTQLTIHFCIEMDFQFNDGSLAYMEWQITADSIQKVLSEL